MNKLLIIPIIIFVVIIGLIGLHRYRVKNGETTSIINHSENSSSKNSPTTQAVNLPKITISGTRFVDSTNNSIVLRGFVNIVNIYAYNDNSFQEYSPADYQKMKSYGANYQSIRLGAKAIG